MDANPKKEAPKEEPVRLEKQEAPEAKIEMANLTRQPEEAQFSNQKIAEDLITSRRISSMKEALNPHMMKAISLKFHFMTLSRKIRYHSSLLKT